MGDAGAENVAALSWTTSRFTARFAPSASENVTLWPTRTSGGAPIARSLAIVNLNLPPSVCTIGSIIV